MYVLGSCETRAVKFKQTTSRYGYSAIILVYCTGVRTYIYICILSFRVSSRRRLTYTRIAVKSKKKYVRTRDLGRPTTE